MQSKDDGVKCYILEARPQAGIRNRTAGSNKSSFSFPQKTEMFKNSERMQVQQDRSYKENGIGAKKKQTKYFYVFCNCLNSLAETVQVFNRPKV